MGHCRQGAKAVCEQHKDEGVEGWREVKRKVGTGQQAGGCYTSRLTLQRPKIRVVVDGLPLGTSTAPPADDVTFDACFLVYLACVLASYLMTSCRKGTYTGRRQEQVTRCK